jgi:hypothetical protein
MKPVVSALNAWSCIVVSVFAIVILSTIGAMFKVWRYRFLALVSLTPKQTGNPIVMGHAEDPKDGNAVATAVFGAVAVYGVCYSLSLPLATPKSCSLLPVLSFADTSKGFLIFCGSQAWLHIRESKRGAISLS